MKGALIAMDFRQIHAKRQAELDEALLRSLHAEETRLQNKLKGLLNEIEGAQRIISEYQQIIRDNEGLVAELQKEVDSLASQERDIVSDQQRWQTLLAV